MGEIAGLFTAFCWSFTSIFFTLSGRIVGSPVVNRTRLVFALVMVSALHWYTQGQWFPLDADLWRWKWMGLSGIIGFVIGDACLFQAFVLIGPRLSMLLMGLNPVISTMLAWVLLDETLVEVELFGILLAVGGVTWVLADRKNGDTSAITAATTRRSYIFGIALGLGGALGQSVGYIASKQGLEGDFSALSGNLMRLAISSIVIWVVAGLNGDVYSNMQTLRTKPHALKFILAGSVVGPFIGVWTSLIAVQKSKLGIATTLISLTPIILIPLARIFFKERITQRAVFGTVVAVFGTALLILGTDLHNKLEHYL